MFVITGDEELPGPILVAELILTEDFIEIDIIGPFYCIVTM
jgi:hypothetical protein